MKILSFFGLFFSLCFLCLCVNAQSNNLPNEKDFDNRKEELINSINAISSYGAVEAVKEIKDNIIEFNSLLEAVKNAQHVDDVIVEVANGLSNIAESYKKIASLKDNIFSVHRKEINNFISIEGDTTNTISAIRSKKNEYIQQIDVWEKSIDSINDNIEKQKIEISLRGKKSIIKSLEAQEEIWKKFYNAQQKILPKLKLNSEKISLMFHILDVNSEVYQQAATAAKLRRSALAALENLSSLTDLQGLIDEMSSNWTQVNDLVQEISSADFRIQ